MLFVHCFKLDFQELLSIRTILYKNNGSSSKWHGLRIKKYFRFKFILYSKILFFHSAVWLQDFPRKSYKFNTREIINMHCILKGYSFHFPGFPCYLDAAGIVLPINFFDRFFFFGKFQKHLNEFIKNYLLFEAIKN